MRSATDPPDVLAGFAERHGISYPLLSDAGSGLIRELGILNEEASGRVEGIPHPGVFVLDTDGTVAEKHFYESYRERDTGPGLLQQVLGIAATHDGPRTQVASDVVQLQAEFDSSSYTWGQRLWLTVSLTIAPGYHVNGRPIPVGYVPLEIEIDPPNRVTVGAPRWPTPKPFRVEGARRAVARVQRRDPRLRAGHVHDRGRRRIGRAWTRHTAGVHGHGVPVARLAELRVAAA